MDSQTLELIVKVFGVLAVISTLVSGVLVYVWNRHVGQVDEQKKRLDELHAAAVTESELAGKLADIRAAHRAEIDELKRRQEFDVERLRDEMNGLGTRLTDTFRAGDEERRRQIEEMGRNLTAQIALLIRMVEQQNARA